jgi:SAM-dependent methyltransferase
MADLSDGAIAIEEARIKSAYGKRSGGLQYSWSNPAYLFDLQELERRLLAILRAQGLYSLNDKKILEIGCGYAYWLRRFIQWGARPENTTGLDLLSDRVAKAKRNFEARQQTQSSRKVTDVPAASLTSPSAGRI